MANVILRVKREDGSWAEIPALVGSKGPQGVSIDDIVLKSQEGDVSTYSILLSDGSEKTFQVTDGASITDVSLISTDVLIDTYKISISDGSFFNFKVTNGRGIKSIAKTSTDVLSDTYTISYNDNTTSTFKVANGRSITKIVKSKTDVLTDTYTISYNDNTTSTYTVTNGKGIKSIAKTSTDILTDTYTISYNDNTTDTYTVTNGKGITKIDKSNTDVLTDTYTISYNDNTTSTYTVTNGKGITKIDKSNTDVLTDTYTISYNDNTTNTYTVTNGRGIDYIEKDETIGLRDKYTIHYNDGSTSYYYVTNGEDGPAGGIGNRIYLTGLVDKVDDEEGYGRVKELKESDFDLSKFTVVGSPIISEDGIASGFDSAGANKIYTLVGVNVQNSITIKSSSTYQTKNIESFVWCWNLNWYVGVTTTNINLKYPVGTLEAPTSAFFSVPVSTLGIELGDTVDITATITPTKVSMLINGQLFEKEVAVNFDYITTKIKGLIIEIGQPNVLPENYYYPSSIDLKNFSIIADGKEVFSGNPTALDTIKANNYTVTGSPTITDDGIFKANATGDYLIKNGFTNEIKKELRCDGRFYYSTKTSNTGNVIQLANGSVVYWAINSDGLITLSDGTNTSTVQIEIPLKDGDIFDTEIIYSASTITLNVCLNEGVNYTTSIASKGLTTFNSWRLSVNENYWGGTIDLNTIHVYIDGNLVYQPCLKIPYTKAKTGSKIVDAAYKLRVEDCYNQYGAGNYYLFSSATEQFALPMPDIYGLIENLKLDITAIEGADW